MNEKKVCFSIRVAPFIDQKELIQTDCENCGSENCFQDLVEGMCHDCGNQWTVDQELFEKRIAIERKDGRIVEMGSLHKILSTLSTFDKN
ncbi:MAG: hypothetical protein JEZ11_14935 [Desulfobacterales bacterium]|nr:hypothetical protein [Desulfobacterales bacterium]